MEVLPTDEGCVASRTVTLGYIQVGPTDEGYVGSWFGATVIETAGGEPGSVCVRYHTLEESDGVPLIEWQVRGGLIQYLYYVVGTWWARGGMWWVRAGHVVVCGGYVVGTWWVRGGYVAGTWRVRGVA